MCLRNLMFACIAFCTCTLADARPIAVWSYEKLNKRAEVVAVVTVKSTEPWDEPLEKTLLVGRLTTFEVKTVLKGQLGDNDQELKLVHFTESEKATTFVNPPFSAVFETGEHEASDPQKRATVVHPPVPPHYLLFLKARKDGKFEPVSGQFDSAFSVMLLKPELAPVDIEDVGGKDDQKK